MIRDGHQAVPVPYSAKPSAVRQRRLVVRRRRGFRCLALEICNADADALARHGLLDPAERRNDAAVEAAIVKLLDDLAQ